MAMVRYILIRLLMLIPVLMGASIIVFTMTRLIGDPATIYINTDNVTPEQLEIIREKYHLNDPIYVQYFYYLNGILRGDWGYSITARSNTLDALRQKVPATIELAVSGLIIALIGGMVIGTKSATNKDKFVDHVSRVLALSGVSIPVFWLALMILMVLYTNFAVIPLGRYDISTYNTITHYVNLYTIDSILNLDLGALGDALWHLLIPSLCLGYQSMAIITRMMRSSLLEVLREGYVTVARSKGLPEGVVIKKHARRNAWIPTVTVTGLVFGVLLTGSVLVESVFSWPGMGRWTVTAIQNLDTSAIMAVVFVSAIVYSLSNLIVDILYVYLDPRVRLGV